MIAGSGMPDPLYPPLLTNSFSSPVSLRRAFAG